MDSTVTFEFYGENCQPGSGWKWSGKKMGVGDLTLNSLAPGDSVQYTLAFTDMSMVSKGTFKLNQEGDSVKVTWTHGGSIGFNPIYRYFGLFTEKMMGPDFQKGLDKLKKVAEERNSWPRIEETKIPAQTVLLVRDSAGPADYDKKMQTGFGEIFKFTQTNKLKSVGHPFAIYIKWDSATQFSVFDMGIAIEGSATGKDRIRIESLPEQKAVKAYYFGPYNKTYNAYVALEKYLKGAGLEEAGGPWEVYVTDPMVEKDTTKWETDILFPVK